MKRFFILYIAMLLVATVGLTGCGRKQRTNVQTTTTTTTLGQELIDLQQAYEKGSIT